MFSVKVVRAVDKRFFLLPKHPVASLVATKRLFKTISHDNKSGHLAFNFTVTFFPLTPSLSSLAEVVNEDGAAHLHKAKEKETGK